MLCLSIKLHKHANIYLGNLFVVLLHCTSLFVAFWFLSMCVCSIVLFGLMSDHKIEYYYYYDARCQLHGHTY